MEITRKRRIDLNLLQREAAAKIVVSETTIFNWENSNTTPSLSSTPKIIAFLGYNPDDSIGKTLGEQLKNKRRQLGLSQRRLAKMLKVDFSTLGQWERGETRPMKKSCEIIQNFLKGGKVMIKKG